jgi:hypothetical protein
MPLILMFSIRLVVDRAYFRGAHVLDGGDLVAYNLQTLISIQLPSVASALFNAPRRSSSRSVRQLMKDSELLITSVVNLMIAVLVRYCFGIRVSKYSRLGARGCERRRCKVVVDRA